MAILLFCVSFFAYSQEEKPRQAPPPAPESPEAEALEAPEAGGEAPEAGGPEAQVPAGEPGLGGIDVEAERRRLAAGEAPPALLSFTVQDKAVVLDMAGTWEGKALGTLGFSAGGLGFQALSTGSPLLFTQEADLALGLRIDDRWFLEARFQDGYDLNTYQAGYRGAEGEAIQYLGLGNTGLDFPSFPYLDLGGDSPSSIGVYGKFGGGNLKFHGLFRYDLSSREERVFVGNRERRQVWLGLDSMERGRSFVLPDEGLDGPPELYQEDEKGDLRDSRGKRWRKLGSGEYGSSAVLGLVEMGASPAALSGTAPGAALAVSYAKNRDPRPWAASLGAYDSSGPNGTSRPGTGSGFLGEASAAFGPGVDLRLWPQPGESPAAPHEPGRERLSNGAEVLIIWERGGFSPFERMSRYRSPSSALVSAILAPVSAAGEAEQARGKIGGYELLNLEEQGLSAELLLAAGEYQNRDIWELRALRGGGERGGRDPLSRWPLLEEGRYAELYLPGGGPFNADMALRFTGYGNAGDLIIGNDVIPGSVKVYRGGMEDRQIRYDEGAGRVVLENPPLPSEVIRITYLKRSQDGRYGSIAAGLGTEYQGEHFGAQAGLGLRWNLGSEAYSEGESGSPGTVGLGALASWAYGDFSAQVRGGFGLEVPDTTGLYRAAGMEGGDYTLSLPAEDSFVSPVPGGLEAPAFTLPPLSRGNRAELVYRNYRENQLGGPVLKPSDWDGAAVVGGREGPYPLRDQRLSSQVLAAEFRFDDTTAWTAFEVPLGEGGAALEGAKLIEVPFRMDGFDGLTAASFSPAPPAAAGNSHGGEFTVLLQFGDLQGQDQSFIEYPAALVEKQIYPQPGNADPNNPAAYGEEARVARIRLSDEDRRKLRGAAFMRLVVVKSPAARPFAGRVMLGAPILQGASFRAVTAGAAGIQAAGDQGLFPSGPSAAAAERVETGANTLETRFGDTIRRLHPGGGQRIMELVWDKLEGGMAVGAEGRVPPLPLARYRSLSFFIRSPALTAPAPAGTVLRFFLARGPEFWESWPGGGETFVEAEIPLEALPASGWSKVELRYGDGEQVRVNGAAAARARLHYHSAGGIYAAGGAGGGVGGGTLLPGDSTAQTVPAGYILLLLDGGGGTLPPGGLALDEIILEEPVSAYQVSGGASARWERRGTLVSFRSRPVLQDVSLETNLESGLRGAAGAGAGLSPAYLNIVSQSLGKTTLLGTKFSFHLGFSGARGAYPGSPVSDEAALGDWNGGHGISRSLGPFSVEETFSLNPAERRADHRFALGFSGSGGGSFPLRSRLGGEAGYQDENRSRRWDFLLGFEPPRKAARFLPALSLEAGTAWKSSQEEDTTWMGSYGAGWTRTWALLVPINRGEGDALALDWGEGEKNRETGGSVTLSGGQGPLSFSLYLEGSAKASAPQSLSQSESRIRLDIPLTIRAWTLGFRGERSFLRSLRSVGLDITEDAGIFGASLEDSGPLWLSVPFYVWGDPELPGKLAESALKQRLVHEYSRFNDNFSLSLAMPPRKGLAALWIPGAAALALGRTTERKLDLDFDVVDLRGTVDFSAVNLLGAWGIKPLFPFYASDEFDHALEGAIAFPREGRRAWRFGSAARLGFTGFAGGALSLRNNLRLGQTGRGEGDELTWAEGLELQWDRPSERGLLKTLWDFMMGALEPRASWLVLSGIPEAPRESRLTERLDLALDRGGEYLTLSIRARHEAHIIIPGRLDFSVFGELGGAWDEKTGTFSLATLLGTGLRVSF